MSRLLYGNSDFFSLNPSGVPVVGQTLVTGTVIGMSGTGAPESVIAAAPGSTWLQTDSTTDVKGWIKWVKATGTGNTGWIAGPEADTGWRKVLIWSGGAFTYTSLGTPHADWTSTAGGWLALRRTRDQVHYWCYGNLHTPASGSGQQVLPSLSGGFGGSGTFTVADSSGHPVQLDAYLNRAGDTSWFDGWLPIAWTATLPAFEAPWPTSLPGVAV